MKKEPDILEAYLQDISMLVEAFSEQEQPNRQSLQRLAGSNPGAFCFAGIRV